MASDRSHDDTEVTAGNDHVVEPCKSRLSRLRSLRTRPGWGRSVLGGLVRRQVGLKFLAANAERDNVHGSLSRLQHVGKLITVSERDACSVDQEVRRSDVGVHVLTEVLEDLPDHFKLDASVEQLLDRVEFQQVESSKEEMTVATSALAASLLSS